MLTKFIIFVIFFVSFYKKSEGIRCYACSIGEQDMDQSCVDSLDNSTMVISCSMRYCRTIRQEYLDPRGKVASIYRGCDDNPQPKNEVIEDTTYRMYYTACQTDLCNGGTGKSSSGLTGSLGDKSMLLVPGLPSSSKALPTVSVVLVGLVLISQVFFSNF